MFGAGTGRRADSLHLDNSQIAWLPTPLDIMGAWNIFRILGDLSHMASKGILIFSIHSNRSAEGVSLITQILYALVFCTRYLDLFHTGSAWNVIFKITYILTSFYILGVMQWVYPRSRERELSWKLGAIILGGAAALSPFAMLVLLPKIKWSFLSPANLARAHAKWMWSFSEILESVCVLPQLLLLRQTTVPTVIDSFYLLALGSYRALYCLNWFVRMFDELKPDALSVIFGIIQTALYADFAWVYYTRQRVKLRGGGVVDADDLRNGWLVQRIFGRTLGHHNEEHDDEEAALHNDQQQRGGARPKWGSRGISVSADEGIFEDEERAEASQGLDEAVDPDAKMQDPDDLARALDDDAEPEDAPLRGQSSGTTPPGVRGGDEWRD
ncbi:protein-ER retention receptor [Cordyceps militaris CM01]|uniref:Protein-ER retention receptor n=1 Tax=Cordyceps militaris (strain CM01) TaxID=983644 RepID=G3J362_CORMM|nr:protein-ER retention receptor [Cordyceps militaris CM01]EGX96443.1 protein-ER retention receptor [Cordyceps militaris CM01]